MKSNFSNKVKQESKEKIRILQELMSERNVVVKENDYVFCITSYKNATYVATIIATGNSYETYVSELRKQGSGKRSIADKVTRCKILGMSLILTSSGVKKGDISDHCLIALVSNDETQTYLQIFKASPLLSKIKWGRDITIDIERFGDSKHVKSVTVEDNMTFASLASQRMQDYINSEVGNFAKTVKEEETKQSSLENNIEEQQEEKIEEQPVVVSKEDTLLDKLVKIDEDCQTIIAKSFIERMLSLPLNEEYIDKVKKLDDNYFYKQGLCTTYRDNESKLDVMKVQLQESESAMQNLQKCINKYKHMIKETEAEQVKIKKSMDKINVTDQYKDISDFINKLEKENTEEALAKKKAQEITANLSEAEKTALLKALGVIPEEKVVENRDIKVVLVDGEKKEIDTSWKSILDHVMNISKGHETPNNGVFVYLSTLINKGMTQKELGEYFNSSYYAKRAFEFCREYKLIDSKKQYVRKDTNAIKKAAATRSKAAKARREVIEESFKKEV